MRDLYLVVLTLFELSFFIVVLNIKKLLELYEKKNYNYEPRGCDDGSFFLCFWAAACPAV